MRHLLKSTQQVQDRRRPMAQASLHVCICGLKSQNFPFPSSKPSTNLYLTIAYRTLENKPLKVQVPISERTPWIWAASPSHLPAKRKTTRIPPCVPFPGGTPQPYEGDTHKPRKWRVRLTGKALVLPAPYPMPCSAWTSVIKLC